MLEFPATFFFKKIKHKQFWYTVEFSKFCQFGSCNWKILPFIRSALLCLLIWIWWCISGCFHVLVMKCSTSILICIALTSTVVWEIINLWSQFGSSYMLKLGWKRRNCAIKNSINGIRFHDRRFSKQALKNIVGEYTIETCILQDNIKVRYI